MMSERMKVAGYVKLAKLWEKRREEAIPYQRKYYAEKFQNSERFELEGVYVDITGNKQIAKRKEMIRLLKDCSEGKVQCIAAQTRGYLAANTQEFCYLVKFLFDMGIHLLTEDEAYHIDTAENRDKQKEALYKMAVDFIGLNPQEYEAWKESILHEIQNQ
jgi:DNA invertase Pin-like site-specific DNA recombinase